MSYFLNYNNAEPLFIGGSIHGQKRRLPSDAHYIQIPIPRALTARIVLSWEDGWDDAVRKYVETYRRERFIADDREFLIMVHVDLPVHAAFMLMLSTVGASPGLIKRCSALEHENLWLKQENAALKRIIKEAFEDIKS